MPDSTPDVSELARQVVDELDGTRQIGNQILLSRREAIALSTGAISLGALGVAGVGNASAQSGVGQVGTEAEPVDVEGAQGNFSQGVTVDGALEADDLATTGDLTTINNGLVGVWSGGSDGGDVDYNLISDGERLRLRYFSDSGGLVGWTARLRLVGDGGSGERLYLADVVFAASYTRSGTWADTMDVRQLFRFDEMDIYFERSTDNSGTFDIIIEHPDNQDQDINWNATVIVSSTFSKVSEIEPQDVVIEAIPE